MLILVSIDYLDFLGQPRPLNPQAAEKVSQLQDALVQIQGSGRLFRIRNRWFSIQVLVLVELYGFSVVLREPSCTIRLLGFVFYVHLAEKVPRDLAG